MPLAVCFRALQNHLLLIQTLSTTLDHRYYELNFFYNINDFARMHMSIVSARQHICYSALFANARPSVRPSVCLSSCLSHGWISQRRLQLGLRNLHHRVAHDSSFLTRNGTLKFQREDRERGRRIREGYEKYAIFSQ